MEMQNQQLPTSLQPQNLKKIEHAQSGCVYVSNNTYQRFYAANEGQQPVYVRINNCTLVLAPSPEYTDQDIALGKLPRQVILFSYVKKLINKQVLQIPLNESVKLQLYKPPKDKEQRLQVLQLELELTAAQQGEKLEVDDPEFIQIFKKQFINHYFKTGMIYVVTYKRCTFQAKVSLVQLVDARAKGQTSQHIAFEGQLVEATAVELTAKHNQYFYIKSESEKSRDILPDIDFRELGIGGLDDELQNIFRRAFASRRFPISKLKKYGISHVKGLLLHGPPGTGKTLIARKLAKALKCKEPKIVNGPEILSKYVGESEENIRKLFADARRDQQGLGDDSPLHIIVFDEIDAICKPRGSVNSGTGVQDTVVNQLLSMIDGVDSLNNVLVIGMTNRKDMIDEAVLRPGRFEVHIEVGLPDEKGRQDILRIHTRVMAENKLLGADVDLLELAQLTKNYTGAELEAVVKSASSSAFHRVHDIMDFTKKNLSEEVIVIRSDFMHAIDTDVKPMFGSDGEKFDILLRNKLIDYGTRFQRILKVINDSIEQTKSGRSSQLHSLLFEGNVGTGKTAIAAFAAMNCGFPYVKLISPENFVGYSETGKINAIVKIFEDAYRSPFSCVVIDNIERIIEFIDIGPRFSNTVLQALLVLVKKVPKKAGHRILILGTTNQAKVLRDLEITQCFNVNLKVPPLEDVKEILTVLSNYSIPERDKESIAKHAVGTPIKKLLLILDMVSASSNNETITFEQFRETFDAISQDM